VCTATSERPSDGCAFERFTDSGPVALLPLGERRVGVVLTVPTVLCVETRPASGYPPKTKTESP